MAGKKKLENNESYSMKRMIYFYIYKYIITEYINI